MSTTRHTKREVFRRLFRAELHHAAATPGILHLVPLLPAGILAVALEYPPAPLTAAVIIALLALEPRFDNVLYRTPNDRAAMGILPVPAHTIVAARNLATLVIALAVAAICGPVMLFFSRTPLDGAQVLDALLLFGSLVFTLLHTGNGRSLQFPRRRSGWRMDDLMEGTGFLITLAVLAFPYLLLVAAFEQRLVCVLYIALTALHWWRRSIARTAARIDRNEVTACPG
jgi:hypothetical protein